MKKNIIQIIILIALIGIIVAAQIVPHGTSRLFDMLKIGKHATIKELRDFNIKDTARVDRIFMVDKENNKIDLRQGKNNQWTVNNKYPAQNYKINLLLETLYRIRIKSPVPEPSEKNLIRKLATKSTKVEIYDGNDIIKTYYIGGVTQSQTGTYAMLEGSSVPFIVEMPGFRGYLSSRFIPDTLLWASPKFFHFTEDQINKIKTKVGDQPKQAFTVEVNGRSNYELFNYQGEQAKTFDTLEVRRFVKQFRDKAFSRYISGKTNQQRDSVYNSKIFYRYNVILHDGKQIELSLHKVKDQTADDILEMDYLYGIIDQKRWVSIQTHLFATMFKELHDFNPEF